MSNEGNRIKNKLLGMPHGTANQRLRKLIMWTLVCKTDQNVCFRCGQKIEDVDDLSIEHKEPWQEADDPKAAFFNLKNIAFSHLRCNCGSANREKENCPAGHPYDAKNTYCSPKGDRRCRQCNNANSRKYRSCGGKVDTLA